MVSCSVEELFPYIVESEALLRAILRHLTGTNISLTRHLKRIAIYDSRQKAVSYTHLDVYKRQLLGDLPDF